MIAALLMQQQLEELDRAINHRLVELFTFQPPVKRFQRLAESKIAGDVFHSLATYQCRRIR